MINLIIHELRASHTGVTEEAWLGSQSVDFKILVYDVNASIWR